MKVTHVSIRPTAAAAEAGRPALTPELLAATGARYSRNNEGLDAILAKIDPENPDKSVDSIFKMIDYGHQSIADMAPVSMFLDGISLWLAYFVWSVCPTAGGQESSTRYLKLSRDGMIPPDQLGFGSERRQAEWWDAMGGAFNAYQERLTYWEELVKRCPERSRIPEALQRDQSPQATAKVARLHRNFGFDRARYFLPVGTATNVMLVMPARGWAQLCQQLLSHELEEPRRLGNLIRQELTLAAPRLLKHAEAKVSFQCGQFEEFKAAMAIGEEASKVCLISDGPTDADPAPFLETYSPSPVILNRVRADAALRHHDNRYAWIGSGLQRMAVRFGWRAVALAEIRDLNRHRTGTKYCPQVPVGFYGALDQVPVSLPQAPSHHLALEIGRQCSRRAREMLADGDPMHVYWGLLGTQYAFEHLTTADKFLYEAELRTGLGAHYRYAQHFAELLDLWYDAYPETLGKVKQGQAEPE